MSCRDNFKSDEQNVTEDLNQDNGKLGHNVIFCLLFIDNQQPTTQLPVLLPLLNSLESIMKKLHLSLVLLYYIYINTMVLLCMYYYSVEDSPPKEDILCMLTMVMMVRIML